MIRQYELVERIKTYDPRADEDLINRAYVFSMQAHGTQMRASGDPYFLHPLEVAGILADMKLDARSIVTGLLHDTVEDTVATLDDIQGQFGTEVAQLVDGVTKLSKLELASDKSKQAENFRKLVLAMSKDIRVLLVKLADRLHNMRTLGAIQDVSKQHRIARETLEIYAPLAERIGIHEMKDELEDLAFTYLNGDARESIVRRLAQLRKDDSDTIAKVIAELGRVLADGGLKAIVTGREKRPFSIWRKMQVRNVPFEQMADIMAFRVFVDTLGDCYQALGLIHAEYASLPGRFKDYISTPKPNGYQSVHTAVIGPYRQRIEIQIRTHEMHEVAELGVAAHWVYKQGKPNGHGDRPEYRWLRELLEILENAQKPEEFLEHTKLELFQDQVFCFTPKGMVIALPQGATPVDFAYAVHTHVGDTCVGAKVNGRMVTLRHALENGDQVEIVTSRTSTPSPEWERFVVTGKARARVRRFVRLQQRTQYASLGKAMLKKLFRQEGYEFTERSLEAVLKSFKVPHVEDVYANVGSGITPSREVFNTVYPQHRSVQQDTEGKIVPLDRARQRSGRGPQDSPLPIHGLIPGMAVHYARCCHPIPGDRIVGIVTTGKGVTIHTIDCETLESFYDQPERWLDVSWDPEAGGIDDHIGRIKAVIANEPGSLGTLTTVIGKNGGNINNLKITHRSTDFFEIMVDITVADVRHLTNIVAALRATPVISNVDRARNG